MPSPNAVFTELVTTTFRNHRSEIMDGVSKHNALYRAIAEGGRSRTEDGGTSIVIPLEYGNNGTYQRYSGLDLLNIAQSDVLSAAEYQWRNIAIHVVSSGNELRINNGPARIANLAKTRIKNAIHTFANNFSADMYGDGSLSNQIGGLQLLVSDAGTGTVGGIDSSAFPFWQSKVQSAAAPMQGGAGITPSGTAGIMESLMLPLYMATTRNNDMVDLIVASDDYFAFYEQGLSSQKQYVDDDSAKAGFMALRYKKAKVIFDGNSGMPASRMYFLNTNNFEVVAHTDANLTVVGDEGEGLRPINQDAAVVPILWMGNMTISNRALMGVLKP
jgi:hypothetical protein